MLLPSLSCALFGLVDLSRGRGCCRECVTTPINHTLSSRELAGAKKKDKKKKSREDYGKRDCKQVVTAHVFTVGEIDFPLKHRHSENLGRLRLARQSDSLFHVIAIIE